MLPSGQIKKFMDGTLLLYLPSFPLSQFVNHLWCAKQCDASRKTIERFLPGGSMDLVFNLVDEAERVLCEDSQDQYLKDSWITGFQSKYMRIEVPKQLCMMGVEFKAIGAYAFFGFPMFELKGAFVSLDLIWGREVIDTRDAILNSKSDEDKFLILESFLLRRLKPCSDLQIRINNAIRLLESSTPPRIREVAQQLGIDQKRFIRQFEEVVGTTPKLFSRICRFQRALQTISANHHDTPLTTIAMSCDYFDQAHFIKEFQEFSGLTPGEYLQCRGLFPSWISESWANGF